MLQITIKLMLQDYDVLGIFPNEQTFSKYQIIDQYVF
jgi:hypothetical protein